MNGELKPIQFENQFFEPSTDNYNTDLLQQAALGSDRSRSKQEAGDYTSANYKPGVSGWALKANGDIEVGSGTFRGTIQTATSGQRIRITTSAATSPTQTANSLMLIDSSNNSLLDFGSTSGVIMTISPRSDVIGMNIIANSGVVLTSNHLITASISDASSTTDTLHIVNAGSGAALYVSPTGAGFGLKVEDSGATASTVDLVRITSGKSPTALKIIKTSDTGYPVWIDNQSTTSSYQALYITSAGAASALVVEQNNASNGLIAATIKQTRPDRSCLYLNQTQVTSTHFKKTAEFGTVVIYTSDGTTPNGNLGANQGDICLGADGGKSYYCTGSTSWTAF